MIKSIVDSVLKPTFLRHKGVHTFRYQGKTYNNAQNNFEPFQVYVDDYSMHQLNITNNVFTSEFEIYVLAQTRQGGKQIIDIQDDAYTIAVDVIKYIELNFKGVVKVHDYSIITLAHYTDDDSAGIKMSLVLQVPNPVNLCEYEENFNEEPVQPEPDKKIGVKEKTITEELKIKKIKLPKTDC